MSIPSHARSNFQTLLRAAGDGNLALMECLDAVTGSPRYVICAVGRDNGDYIFTDGIGLNQYNPTTNVTIRSYGGAASSSGQYINLVDFDATGCPADFNGDGFLDFTDFDDFVGAFEAGNGSSDFNNDGFLDFTDFDEFVAAFEAGC